MKFAILPVAAAAALLLSANAFAAETVVDQQGQKFVPNAVTVKVGDSIKFLNSDDVDHNVTVIDGDGNADDRGIQKPGTPLTVKFSKAGDFAVRCSVHPRMKMTVKVE